MKNKNKKQQYVRFSLMLLFFISLVSFISAEGCYVRLNFNETLNELPDGNFTTSFDLINLENIYGNYESQVYNASIFNETMPYTLRINYLAGYSDFSFDTSLFIYYDDFGNETNPGGSFLLNESINSVIVPYVNPLELNGMVVYFDNREIYRFLPSGISCNRDCISVKEFSNVSGRCCEGLTKVFLYNTNNFTCTNCGDGVCGRYESSLTCLSDCSRNITYNCSEGFVVSKYGCVEENVCGNDVIDSGESCDDGNNQSADGCNSVCEIEGSCADSDDEDVFTKGYFRYNCSGDDCGDGTSSVSGEDICLDSQNLLENYCGYNFRWDFWNMELEPKTFTQTCQYGCEYGRCLTAEEIGVPVVLDLPDEPSAPVGGFE